MFKNNFLCLRYWFVFIGFWALVLGFHWAFGQPVCYNLVGKYIKTYQQNTQTGDDDLVAKPFLTTTDQNFCHWDAKHYDLLKYFYFDKPNYTKKERLFNEKYHSTPQKTQTENFAFFPLFPFVWWATGLGNIGIALANIVFFGFGLWVLCLGWRVDLGWRLLVLLMCLPSLVCFAIPYSEAVFFVCCSMAIYHFLKGNYWFYALFMVLSSMARPVVVILSLSFLVVECLNLVRHKNLFYFIKSLVINVLPIFFGTFLVGLFQVWHGAKSVLSFMRVQSSWGNRFSFPPSSITDYSVEQHGINLALVVFFIVPIVWILSHLVVGLLKINSKNKFFSTFHTSLFFNFWDTKTTRNISTRQHLFLLSMVYCLGLFLIIFLFRNGSLHSLFRFVLCNPFFYVLLFVSKKYFGLLSKNKRLKVFFSFYLALLVYVLGFNFAAYHLFRIGFWGLHLLSGFVFCWLMADVYSTKKWFVGLQVFLFISNALWTSYLLNVYASDAYIFG